MKKKIKDLTLKESRMICVKQECSDTCPFYSLFHRNCSYLIDVFEAVVDSDREVEIDEINND